MTAVNQSWKVSHGTTLLNSCYCSMMPSGKSDTARACSQSLRIRYHQVILRSWNARISNPNKSRSSMIFVRKRPQLQTSAYRWTKVPAHITCAQWHLHHPEVLASPHPSHPNHPDYIRLSIDYHDMSVFVHAARQCTTYHVSDLVMFGIWAWRIGLRWAYTPHSMSVWISLCFRFQEAWKVWWFGTFSTC